MKRNRRLSLRKQILIVLLLICVVFLAIGIRLLSKQAEKERLLKRYPATYIDEISTYAGEFCVDPYLVISIMKCESNFNADAVSNRGAVGLMQIMPDTGDWIAHKLNMDDSYNVDMLHDPDMSIRFACWYLNFLNGRFDGDEKKVVAAYNAGHRTVEKWLEDERYSENGSLLIIPYIETSSYFDKVMLAKNYYHSLYDQLF